MWPKALPFWQNNFIIINRKIGINGSAFINVYIFGWLSRSVTSTSMPFKLLNLSTRPIFHEIHILEMSLETLRNQNLISSFPSWSWHPLWWFSLSQHVHFHISDFLITPSHSYCILITSHNAHTYTSSHWVELQCRKRATPSQISQRHAGKLTTKFCSTQQEYWKTQW